MRFVANVSRMRVYLRLLRLKNDLMANEVADRDADLLLGETQRAQRSAKSVGVESE